jgi:hypothetical protein
MQGGRKGLSGVLGDHALHLRNDSHGVWAGHAGLRRPETDGGVVQGVPRRPKLLAAGSVTGPELRRPSSHGKLGGGSSGKVGTVYVQQCVWCFEIAERGSV